MFTKPFIFQLVITLLLQSSAFRTAAAPHGKNITEISFLRETIFLPDGLSDEYVHEIQDVLHTYEIVFAEIESGANNCRYDGSELDCSTIHSELQDSRKDFLEAIDLLKRKNRNQPQNATVLPQARCFLCMNLFVDRVNNVLDDYIIHLNFVFSVNKKGATDSPPTTNTTDTSVISPEMSTALSAAASAVSTPSIATTDSSIATTDPSITLTTPIPENVTDGEGTNGNF